MASPEETRTFISNDGAETFPAGFLWGAATGAHQVEGGNVNNNYWEAEHRPGTGFVEPSGDACDSAG